MITVYFTSVQVYLWNRFPKVTVETKDSVFAISKVVAKFSSIGVVSSLHSWQQFMRTPFLCCPINKQCSQPLGNLQFSYLERS